MKMFSHDRQPDGKDEWLTPPAIIKALGPFDLDPCAPVERPWPTAEKHYTILDNGLNQPWEGFVWMNPPYGREVDKWMARLADHGQGIALIFARTETKAWQRHVWARASAILFLDGRLTFHHRDGRQANHSAGAPSALVAYGECARAGLEAAHLGGRINGALVTQWQA